MQFPACPLVVSNQASRLVRMLGLCRRPTLCSLICANQGLGKGPSCPETRVRCTIQSGRICSTLTPPSRISSDGSKKNVVVDSDCSHRRVCFERNRCFLARLTFHREVVLPCLINAFSPHQSSADPSGLLCHLALYSRSPRNASCVSAPDNSQRSMYRAVTTKWRGWTSWPKIQGLRGPEAECGRPTAPSGSKGSAPFS